MKGRLKIASGSTEFAIQIKEDVKLPTKKRKTLNDAAKTARNKRSRDNKKRKKQEAVKAKIDLITKETKNIEAQAAALEEKKKSIAGAVAQAKTIFDEANKLPPFPASEYQQPPKTDAKEKKPKANRRTHRNSKTRRIVKFPTVQSLGHSTKEAARTADRERKDREKQHIHDSPKRKQHLFKTIRTPSRSSVR